MSAPAPARAHDVFISYSTRDSATAEAIVGALEKRGISCWIAQEDIPAAKGWPEQIVRAIQSSRVVLVVFSRNSDASEQVLREITLAAESRRPLLPVRIEDVKPEGGSAYFLADRQWFDLSRRPVIDLGDHLAAAVRQAMGETPDKKVRKFGDWPRPTATTGILIGGSVVMTILTHVAFVSLDVRGISDAATAFVVFVFWAGSATGAREVYRWWSNHK
ncbi:MAG: toll/interleukin-1 receptor domain-containing protein [Bryobacterales bacterium]|nr:toll/interleukin-1 receptor domain-containing protein [Bryobacterales bacterium]